MSQKQGGCRRGPAGRSGAGIIRGLVLAGLTFFPLTAVGQDTPPLISTMYGELKQACRTAANVDACEFMVEVLRAYFGPTYLHEKRLAIGGSNVLGLQPAKTSCDECIQAVQGIDIYLVEGVAGEMNNAELIAARTLSSACDRKFRIIPSEAAQCKAELLNYAPLAVDIFLSEYPPLPFCRIKERAYCPPLAAAKR